MNSLVTTTSPLLYDGGNTKKEIENLALLVIEETLEKGTPIELAEKIAATENLIKVIKDNQRFTDYVKEELAKSCGKVTTESGARIEEMEAGVKYDYSANTEWVELMLEENAIAKKRKALEERLKAIPAGKLLVDEETGETLIGPAKSSKTTYKVTLK
jgi:hypothetical protein